MFVCFYSCNIQIIWILKLLDDEKFLVVYTIASIDIVDDQIYIKNYYELESIDLYDMDVLSTMFLIWNNEVVYTVEKYYFSNLLNIML